LSGVLFISVTQSIDQLIMQGSWISYASANKETYGTVKWTKTSR